LNIRKEQSVLESRSDRSRHGEVDPTNESEAVEAQPQLISSSRAGVSACQRMIPKSRHRGLLHQKCLSSDKLSVEAGLRLIDKVDKVSDEWRVRRFPPL
jgi:hypothetical protein